MNRTHGFITQREFVEHKLRTRTRTEKAGLDNCLFSSAYDKACSSQRVATVSCVAASTTGVSVDSTHNVSRINTNGGTDVNR